MEFTRVFFLGQCESVIFENIVPHLWILLANKFALCGLWVHSDHNYVTFSLVKKL